MPPSTDRFDTERTGSTYRIDSILIFLNTPIISNVRKWSIGNHRIWLDLKNNIAIKSCIFSLNY